MRTKWFTPLVGSFLVATFAFVGGYYTRTVLAQQNSDAGPTAEKLPPDIHPETLARIGWATRDEFTTAEDLAAFDRAVAAAPSYAKPANGMAEGNGIRLHIPIVHTAYRDTIQNLNQNSSRLPREQCGARLAYP
jgi:hypothetical protein